MGGSPKLMPPPAGLHRTARSKSTTQNKSVLSSRTRPTSSTAAIRARQSDRGVPRRGVELTDLGGEPRSDDGTLATDNLRGLLRDREQGRGHDRRRARRRHAQETARTPDSSTIQEAEAGRSRGAVELRDRVPRLLLGCVHVHWTRVRIRPIGTQRGIRRSRTTPTPTRCCELSPHSIAG